MIIGDLPDKVNHYGYVEGLSLRLHRRFVYRVLRSTLTRNCKVSG